MRARNGIAIACASGGFRGAFVHGVLTAFEEQGFRADAYAAVSSTALPAACAATGVAATVGVEHWCDLLDTRARSGGDMSPVVLRSLEAVLPRIAGTLFESAASRLLLAACAVTTAEAAAETQGDGARRLGRRLLVAAGRGDRRWAEDHLEAVLFDSAARTGVALTRDNLAAVIYASTRMLHAWSVPAEIDGRPYVDGTYLLACPAEPMAALDYRRIVAVGTQPGPIPLDLVGDRVVPREAAGISIETITPDRDPAALGVDVTAADAAGLATLYEHGRESGTAFLA